MGSLYVVCELGAELCRVLLGTLHQGEITISEIRRFKHQLLKEKNSVQWNIPEIYQEILEGLRSIGSYDEAVAGISCHSCPADYLLFSSDGSFLTPAFHASDPRTKAAMNKFLDKIPWETIYDETGIQKESGNTLFQLATESSRRLNRARQLLPIADAFNYFLSNIPRIEVSLASATQLFNPITKTWSNSLLDALHISRDLFPAVVPSGTVLGDLRPDVAKETRLEETKVVAGCSHELAAALAGLPICKGENWAFLQLGTTTLMGAELPQPLINDASREMKFTNQLGHGGAVSFYKPVVGLSILKECRRYWKEKDTGLDDELLTHLAISAPPFEAFINPNDPRFTTGGDMPAKIQDFCRETDQRVPRKPGPIIRCVLESLALTYRQTLREIEYLTDSQFTKLYILGGADEDLLNHFIANALEVPTVVAPPETPVLGSVVVQSFAFGQFKSFDQARDSVRRSFRMETIMPHATAWHAAYDRLADLLLC